MPPSQRLADLEKILELRYKILGDAEKRLAITDEIFAKSYIQQRIREEVLPELHQYEAEYWEVLTQEARTCAVEEVEAQNAIVKIVPEVEAIANQPSANYAYEFMELLLEIRDKLNKPETPAAAKLKAALPLVPGILSYEVELDTESSLRRAFQPIRRLFKEALEKN
jgi:hypothetical protein